LNKSLSERNCVGDASETGLIRFCESLLPIELTRVQYPVFSYKLDDGGS
jgi:hypothetical protein